MHRRLAQTLSLASRQQRTSLRNRCQRSLHSSVNADEIAHFSRLSSQWWDERGEFALLHRMNPVRARFIRDKVVEAARDDGVKEDSDVEVSGRALEGLDALDVGCGGGLLSESLARLGARTLAIDASESNIGIASLHASHDPYLNSPSPPLEYRHTTAEALLTEPKRFDVVCSMEVLEHVDHPVEFLKTCSELVKPGGHLFLSTIARTPLAQLLTITLAERVLGLVTPGTHTHSKYINHSELIEFFQDEMGWISRTYNGVPPRTEAEARGIAYIPWEGRWRLLPRNAFGSMECNYLFWVRRPRN